MKQLPAPQVAVWGYESTILKTKYPIGPGNYRTVEPDYNQNGGGKEAVIYQKLPVSGVFILGK